MRKLITILCLTAFVALQYGKIVSYWHCKLIAPPNCDCQKTLVAGHTDKDHPHIPITTAKEKAEEVYLTHEHIIQLPVIITTDNNKQGYYNPQVPTGHSASIFQPPRA
jgi:hypothetical protein